MAKAYAAFLDKVLEKQGIPKWAVGPIVEYLKSRKDKIGTIKSLLAIISSRKKPVLTKTTITLQNGMEFRINDILYVVSLFYFGEAMMHRILENWMQEKSKPAPEYALHFQQLLDITDKHKNAIKNLLDGMDYALIAPPQHIKSVFDAVEQVSDWNERIFVIGFLLRNTYDASFGAVFYKIFYRISPEYMKLVSAALEYKAEEAKWFEIMSISMISKNKISQTRVIGITHSIVSLINRSIKKEMGHARKMHISPEIDLLRRIAIAHVFSELSAIMPGIDSNKEEKKFV
jgi:hypothetical protein